MKRLALLGLLAAGMTLLAGCPIFDDSPGGQTCFDNCGYGGSTSPTTAPGQCAQQSDCGGINETCGSDGFCHTGDCTLWGCVGAQSCQVTADQKAECADPIGHGGTGGAAMGGASQGGAAMGGSSQGGAAMGGASSAGGTGGATMTGGAGGSTASGGAGGSTKTGGAGGM